MEIIGIVKGINTSDGLNNLIVLDKMQNRYNIKTSLNAFKIGYVYVFQVVQVNKDRVSFDLVNYQNSSDLDLSIQDEILRCFYAQSPITIHELMTKVYEYIDKIDSKCIKDITKYLVDKQKREYFTFPAATRMHHAYVGGLAYHSLGMLKVADSFLKNYTYLKKDYLYAGVILHDIGKTYELTGVEETEYTIDGQLLGHLIIGALEINKAANKLGYDDSSEVKALEHMLISHHGQPQFGAAKRPQTPEAIALWYIDTIDSKFRALGEELQRTPSGTFTDTIGVLDKTKVYKE